jgi:Zn-dependent peptidase ImmA (M78 family)
MVSNPHFDAHAGLTKAEMLLGEKNLSGQFPIPLEALAKSIGYDTVFFNGADPDSEKIRDVSGAVDHTKKKIYINRADPLVRQRFTLAHEIGHAYLHAGDGENVIDFRRDMDGEVNVKEVEANRFAADLLMPRLQFAKIYVVAFGKVRDIARYFTVSEDAVKIRIRQLRLDRV